MVYVGESEDQQKLWSLAGSPSTVATSTTLTMYPSSLRQVVTRSAHLSVEAAQPHVKSKSGKTVKIIYYGGHYNATLEADIEGWSKPGFSSSSRSKTRLLTAMEDELVPAEQPPVRRVEEVKPQRFVKSASGKQLVDFGQNPVGWLRLNVDGPKNTTIRLRHAEVLEDGELALRPLRLAKAEDYSTLSGNGLIEWDHKFKFHGFRYVEIVGWPKEAPLDANSVKAFLLRANR
ncbi:hypothetical protein FGADI_7504 [Fusarium gaditjirri]|uniref:Alpha-L-rhamnosidase concanavalin-like domain-containing protein n=1 Tax=Fusarium gaditjirri TaxID=282569 RepID=A0A8H4T4R5_9HYPO|nr:hypothetical protein FGADI_7504 [Fusarium gaditjirri]